MKALGKSVLPGTPWLDISRLHILLCEPVLHRFTELARGKSNKKISTELFVSELTVKTHVKKFFVKLNIISRTGDLTPPSSVVSSKYKGSSCR